MTDKNPYSSTQLPAPKWLLPRFRSFVVNASALYAPFGLLLLLDGGWTSYRISWICRLPILPELQAGALFKQSGDYALFVVSSFTTLLLLTLSDRNSAARWESTSCR